MYNLGRFPNEIAFTKYLNGKKVKLVHLVIEILLSALYKNVKLGNCISISVDYGKTNHQMRCIYLKNSFFGNTIENRNSKHKKRDFDYE